MELKKVVFAAILAAISVVLDVLSKYMIGIQTMGTGYYAIPIIIAAIFLGVKYSVVVAVLADLVSVLLAGQTILPLFVLGPIFWGLIPALFLNKDSSLVKIVIVVIFAHLLATLANTLALYVHIHGSITQTLIGLPLRLGLIIPNSLIIAFIVEAIKEALMLRPSFLNNDE